MPTRTEIDVAGIRDGATARALGLVAVLLTAFALAGCAADTGAGGQLDTVTPDTLTVATQGIPVAGFWEGNAGGSRPAASSTSSPARLQQQFGSRT